MTDLKDLRADYEQAEARAQKLQAEKDDALAKVRDKYASKLQDANHAAADAQKALNDAEAAQALTDRDDLDDEGKQRLADTLGLTLPA